MVEHNGNVADDGTKRPMHDDSSQDSRQPVVGPAIIIEPTAVPADPGTAGAPYGEVIDLAPIGKDNPA